MISDIHALLEVQELDMLADKIVARLEKLNRTQMIDDKLVTAAKMLSKAEGDTIHQDVQVKDLELEAQSLDEKIKACDKRLYGGSVSNPKELSALEKELAALKDKRKRMDDDLLPLIEAATAIQSKKDQVLDATKTLKERRTQTEKVEKKERKLLEGKLKLVRAKREKEAAKVQDKAFLARYESVRRKTKDSAISRVKGGKCETCRVVVASNALHRLVEPGKFDGCENCGRILVIVE